jgi:dCTP deaminase
VSEPDGVLPRQAIRKLIDSAHILADSKIPDSSLQPASLDLRLGGKAFRLRCSFLPGTRAVSDKLREYQMGEVDLTHGAVLEQNRPYLIPLQEGLRLPSNVRGRANPRSSTGRVDVFTRVVTEYGQHFDEIPAGYVGALYLEIIPLSFTIKVREGLTLNQLRFVTGTPRLSDQDLKDVHRDQPLIFPGPTVDPGEHAWVADGLFLTVDLSGRGQKKLVGYRAKKSTALLELERRGYYKIDEFWERVYADSGKLILEPNEFYLLVSRERVRIPPRLAAEMAAYDPTSGELRTHYAGFFDPGFGVVPGEEPQGTHAVLEVRAHDVSFALEHGQRLCKLTFETMLEEPEEIYGAGLGSNYQRQYLALGRQFKADKSAHLEGMPELVLFRQPMPLQSDTAALADFGVPPLQLASRD